MHNASEPAHVTRQEWMWVAWWSLVLLVLTGLPYLLGACLETPQRVFSGFFVAVEDGNNYLAAMRQGVEGRWAFNNPFTPEAHTPGYVFLFYLLLGKIARLAGLSLPLTLHLSRLLTTPFLLVAVYRFVAHFTGWRIVRRLSFFLVAVGGGLGWFWLLAGQPFAPGVMPTDLWVPDASAFLTMLTFPHLAIAQALILWVAASGLQLLHAPSWRRSALAGLLGLLLSLVHPYSLPVVLALLSLCWALDAWRRRSVRPLAPGQHEDYATTPLQQQGTTAGDYRWISLAQLATIGLVATPYLVYSFLLFSYNPVFHSWQVQSRTWSPDPVHYLLGFGLIGLLVLIGLLNRRPLKRWPDYPLLVLWVVLVPVGLYIPSNLQRRFLDGYQAPLTLVAVAGLLFALRHIRPTWRKRVMLLVGAVSTLSNVALLIGFTALAVARPPLVFNQRQVLDSMDWLAAHAPPGSVVLGAYDTGNLLPSRAAMRTFVGHGPQSVNADEKRALVGAFFSASSGDDQRLALLAAYHIDYVFYGPSERALGDFSPATLLILRPIYDNGMVQIYQVTPQECP